MTLRSLLLIGVLMGAVLLVATLAGADVPADIENLIQTNRLTEALKRVEDLLRASPNDSELKTLRDDLEASVGAPAAEKATPPPKPKAAPSRPPAGTSADREDLTRLDALRQVIGAERDAAVRQLLLAQFLEAAVPYLERNPSNRVVWATQAAAAFELDRPLEGKAAAWALQNLGADRSTDPQEIRLMARLKLKGWITPPSKMIKIPGGPFLMGCNESVDNDCHEDDKPSQTVNVGEFSINETEVTVSQYGDCVNAGACFTPNTGNGCNWGVAGRESHPINCVYWDQAHSFCRWKGGRLPSEAEWEKAARGTDGGTFPWGNQAASCSLANVGLCGNDTAPVGNYPKGASPYGVFDMAGNVFEWTDTWYFVNEARSIRGGSFSNGKEFARASKRYLYNPLFRTSSVGFRCAQ
jgi:formylglycine-generating enzyme required for sulfatase activity